MLLFPALAGAQALPFTAAETDAASIIANDIALRIGAYFHYKASR